jgi:hypothetical protein
MLNEQTACYQRGYCPKVVYDECMEVFSEGFDHDVEAVTYGLRDLTYDFIITVNAPTDTGETVAAACMVELRCSETEGAIPILYIFELTTRQAYGRHGLAQQMVHATDTLAFLLQHSSEPQWHHTLNGRRLFISLTVYTAVEESYWKSLVKLYSRCGLYARRSDTPHFNNLIPFTPYSDRSWDPEHNTQTYIAMYKEAFPGAVYDNGNARVIVGGDEAHDWALYYYGKPIPDDMIDTIRRNGITPENHAFMHSKHSVFLATPTFTRSPPTTTGNVFAVKAVCAVQSFEMRISVPSWFAVFIGKADQMSKTTV